MTTKQLYLRAIRQWMLSTVVAALVLFLVHYQPATGRYSSSDYGHWDTPTGVGLFFINSLGLAALALLTSFPVPLWLGFLLRQLSLSPVGRTGWQRIGWLLGRLVLFDAGFVLLVAALVGGNYWESVQDVTHSLRYFLVTGLVIPLLLNQDLLRSPCPPLP